MKRFFCLVLLLASLVMAGCSFFGQEPATPPPAQQISFIVYRADLTGSEKLVTEEITLPANEKSVAENALRTLLYTQPKSKDMAGVLPADVKLLDFKVDEKGTAYVNFSKEIVKRGQG